MTSRAEYLSTPSGLVYYIHIIQNTKTTLIDSFIAVSPKPTLQKQLDCCSSSLKIDVSFHVTNSRKTCLCIILIIKLTKDPFLSTTMVTLNFIFKVSTTSNYYIVFKLFRIFYFIYGKA